MKRSLQAIGLFLVRTDSHCSQGEICSWVSPWAEAGPVFPPIQLAGRLTPETGVTKNVVYNTSAPLFVALVACICLNEHHVTTPTDKDVNEQDAATTAAAAAEMQTSSAVPSSSILDRNSTYVTRGIRPYGHLNQAARSSAWIAPFVRSCWRLWPFNWLSLHWFAELVNRTRRVLNASSSGRWWLRGRARPYPPYKASGCGKESVVSNMHPVDSIVMRRSPLVMKNSNFIDGDTIFYKSTRPSYVTVDRI